MTAFRRWAVNRADLICGALILVVLTAAVCWLVVSEYGQQLLSIRKGLVAAILTGWGTLSLALIGGAIKITSARQGLISLFSSEIKAIQYGLSCMDMFAFWKSLYADPSKGAVGFADTPRDEQYFEIFHSVADNIGNLHPQVVEPIVRFYTYLKMSRDAAAALRGWKEQSDMEIRRLHVRYVVSLLALSMLWGFVALWLMGYKARVQEQDLLQQINVTYDGVLGPDKFNQLWADHVKKAELEQFFSYRGS
jgi:hypothetical protein